MVDFPHIIYLQYKYLTLSSNERIASSPESAASGSVGSV